MKLPNTNRVLALSLLPLFSAPALAQFPPAGGYQTIPSSSNTVTAPVPFADADRVVFGQIAGDQYPGALAHLGGKAYAIFDPAAHDSMFEIETGVNDLDILDPEDDGDSAGMILALSDGVWLYEWDSTLATNAISETRLSAGDFADLDLIRSGYIDNAGRQDLMGADGADVFVLVEDGTGWSAGGSFTAGGTVAELIAIDWDSLGSTDGHIAVLLPTKVEIWGSNGASPPVWSLTETFLGATSLGQLAKMPPTTGDARRRLAWAAPVGSNTYMLGLSIGGGRENCGYTADSPVSLSTAIYRSNGLSRVDLLSTVPGSVQARMYEQQASTPVYSWQAGQQLTWNAGSSASAGDQTAAFSDVTGDGVPDALVPRAANNALYFFSGQEAAINSITPSNIWSQPSWSDAGLSVERFGLTVDVGLVDPAVHTHWQMLVWRSPTGTSLEATPKNYIWPAIEDAPGSESQELWVDLSIDPNAVPAQDICAFDEAYFISLRLIKIVGDQIQNPSQAIHAVAYNNGNLDPVVNPNNDPVTPISQAGSCGNSQTGGPGFIQVASLPSVSGQPVIPAFTTGFSCVSCTNN